MATTKNIQSIERAFAILESFLTAENGEQSLKELSDHVALNKSTVFGLVNTLVNLGYLKREEHTQQYSLGYRFLTFSDSVKAENLLLKTIQPYLVSLSGKYGETVHCAVEHHGKVIYLDKVTAPQSISISSQIGKENWMHCTGVGKCLLAHMPQEELVQVLSQDLPAFTANTITSAPELEKELEQIRTLGYAQDREEIELGLSCVAVPVFDNHGRVCCAISVSGLTPRIRLDLENGITYELKRVAREISAHL